MRPPLAWGSPGGRVFHDFLRSLWHQGDLSGQDRQWQQGVSAVFYDLVALAMRGSTRPEERATDHALRDKVLALVDAHLGDPALRTLTLADACHASVRTIQNVFAMMGTTPSGYILERRLRRARAGGHPGCQHHRSGVRDGLQRQRLFRALLPPAFWRGAARMAQRAEFSADLPGIAPS
jgi:methylphosphotriester-DNA--protein-cysteine methyltransferase